MCSAEFVKEKTTRFFWLSYNSQLILEFSLQKFLVAVACLITMISAQRPFFAGSGSNGVPELASRFRTNPPSSTSGASTTTVASNIANRVGDADASSTTAQIPVDARGDEELIKRIATWPRENQPFWYINAQHIEKQRNPQGGQTKQNSVCEFFCCCLF